MKKNYLCMIAVVLIISGVMTAYRCSNDQKQTAVSPTDDSSQFTNITDVVPDAILEIRYYGTYNFVGTRVDHFVRWAEDIPDTLMKTYFYPDLDKSVLFEQEYILTKAYSSNKNTSMRKAATHAAPPSISPSSI